MYLLYIFSELHSDLAVTLWAKAQRLTVRSVPLYEGGAGNVRDSIRLRGLASGASSVGRDARIESESRVCARTCERVLNRVNETPLRRLTKPNCNELTKPIDETRPQSCPGVGHHKLNPTLACS